MFTFSIFFLFKQKPAYEMRISDWSSDVCSSDLSKVQEALKAKFGDKAQEAVAAKAAELGVSPSELGDLASKSPAMVLALFQTTGQSGPKPTSGSANIPPINHGQPPVGRPEKSEIGRAHV